MNNKKYWVIIALLAILAVLIRLFSANPLMVEHYYSDGLYLYISIFLRYLLGWLPFSIGDILYGLVTCWLLIKIGAGIRALVKRQLFSRGLVIGIQLFLVQLLSIYIVFNVLWGINYNRRGIASQLGLSMDKYSLGELIELNEVLLDKVNICKDSMLQQAPVSVSSGEIFNRSQDAYDELNKQYDFLNYHPASLKSSLWGWLGNYLGFLGYYNPFTGEGQVNTTVPAFLQPYTNCHEIAHQLGYAKENEANFVGYLAAVSSKDVYFHYSAYLELFLYANRNLFITDSLASKAYIGKLLPPVKEDLKEWRRFNLDHKSPVEPVIRWIYGKYLESNQQPSGVLSYDEVTAFLVAYHKKYGRL